MKLENDHLCNGAYNGTIPTTTQFVRKLVDIVALIEGVLKKRTSPSINGTWFVFRIDGEYQFC